MYARHRRQNTISDSDSSHRRDCILSHLNCSEQKVAFRILKRHASCLVPLISILSKDDGRYQLLWIRLGGLILYIGIVLAHHRYFATEQPPKCVLIVGGTCQNPQTGAKLNCYMSKMWGNLPVRYIAWVQVPSFFDRNSLSSGLTARLRFATFLAQRKHTAGIPQ